MRNFCIQNRPFTLFTVCIFSGSVPMFIFTSGKQLENYISHTIQLDERNSADTIKGVEKDESTNTVSHTNTAILGQSRMMTRQRSAKRTAIVTVNHNDTCKLLEITSETESVDEDAETSTGKAEIKACHQDNEKISPSQGMQLQNNIKQNHLKKMCNILGSKENQNHESENNINDIVKLKQDSVSSTACDTTLGIDEMSLDEFKIESDEVEESDSIEDEEESMSYMCELCGWIFFKSSITSISLSQPHSIPAGVSAKRLDIIKYIKDIHSDCEHSTEEKYTFPCKICGSENRNSQEAIDHFVHEHSVHVTCKKCKETILSYSDISNHLKDHTPCKVNNNKQKNSSIHGLKCSLCGIKVQTRYNLERHIKRRHKEKTYSCDTCSKKFVDQCEIEKHKEVHKVNFKCDVKGCCRTFSREANYLLHKEKHETKKSVHVCTVCGKMCPNMSKLNYHMKYHAKDRLLKCPDCGKAFKTKDVLSKHQRIHNATRHYYCDICGKGFDQSGSMQRHMLVHTDLKPHKCNICGREYRSISSFKTHKLRTNHYDSKDRTDVPVIECDECGKQFLTSTRHEYKRHILTHTGERPYRCKVCNKSFNDKSNLKHHIKIHEDDRPFSCTVCDKRFIHNRSLRKHMEGHEKINVERKAACVSMKQEPKPPPMENNIDDSGLPSLSNFDILRAAASQIEKWARENNETQFDDQAGTLENRPNDQSNGLMLSTDSASRNTYINCENYAISDPSTQIVYDCKPITSSDQFESEDCNNSNQVFRPASIVEKWPVAVLEDQELYVDIEPLQSLQSMQPVPIVSVSTDNTMTVIKQYTGTSL